MIKTLFITLFASILVFLEAQTTTKTYVYKTVGDLNIEALVISPTLPPGQLSPVAFAIHLGGLVIGNKYQGFTPQQRDEILSRNWTIVSIDYRLTPAVLLQDVFEDVQDAYYWVRNELSKIEPINPDIITVFGKSAGGGLALISGFKLSPRPKAIIALYPYFANYNDADSNDYSSPPSQELLNAMAKVNQTISNYTEDTNNPRVSLFHQMCYGKKQGWAMVSRDPDEPAKSISEKLKSFSAVDNLDKDYPPTYLSHGLHDSMVLFTQSVQMAKALEDNKTEFVLDLVLGAEHAYDIIDSSQETWETHILPMINFAAKFMKE